MIVKSPTVTLQDGANPAVDISCYVVAVELTTETEMIDVGTFCDPGAMEAGRTTRSGTLSCLWSETMYTALDALTDTVLEMVVTPVAGTTITVDVIIPAPIPFGRFEIGQRVETDVPLILQGIPVVA